MNPLNKIKNFIFGKSYNILFPSRTGDGDSASFEGKTSHDYLKYNEISLYLNRAIEKRAEKTGEVKFVLKDKKGNIIERNDEIDLLNKPNDFHTGMEFWKLWNKYLDLTGEAFIYLEKGTELFETKKVKAMHLLRPDLVTIVFKEDGTGIEEYVYKNNNKEFRYTPDQVLYKFNPDPLRPLRGISLLKAGIREIETGIQLSEYQAKLLKNGGKVDGVFKFKTANISKDQLKDIKDSYKNQREELEDYDNNLFLGGDTDYIQLGLKPQELGYLESKKVTLDDICIMTGVPRAVLAVASSETYSNADASLAIFLRETIKPQIQALTTFLDWRFIPEDFDLDFIDPTPEDIDRKIKILEAANTTNSATTNEKREMLGLDPSTNPDADEILIPFSLTPLGSGSANTEKTLKKKTSEQNHPLKDPALRKMYGNIQLKRLDKRRSKMESVIKTYFNAQESRIIEKINGTKDFHKKGVVDNVFNSTMEIKLASSTILPLLKQFLIDGGNDAFDLMGSAYTFNVNATLQHWLDQRANSFASDVTETTFAKLKDQFAQSFAAGESNTELIKRIKGTYDGFTKARATTIARTETHGAIQKGTVEGYKQTGSNVKIWVWASGINGGSREDHEAMDGEERPMDMPFSNGLMWPGDPAGDAEDTINCECSI